METGELPVVELDVQVTLEDYTRINWWQETHAAIVRVGLAAWPLAALLLVVGGFAVPPARADFLVAASCVPLFWLVVWARWVRAVRRAYASNKSAQVSHRYCFSRDGVGTESSMNSGKQTWDCYWRAVEAPSAFCLHISNRVIQLLPKRCFTSEEQMQRFREIVRAAMGERAKAIKG